MLLLTLGFVVVLCAVLTVAHLSTKSLDSLALSLGGKRFLNLIRFPYKGTDTVLVRTSAHGTQSLAGAFGKSDGELRPLFDMYVPVQASCEWFIRVERATLMERALKTLAKGGREVRVGGARFKVWAREIDVQSKIEKVLPELAPRLLPLFDANKGINSLVCTRQPRFVGWRPRFGWYIDFRALPEGIHKQPERIRGLLDEASDVIRGLGLLAKPKTRPPAR